MWCTEIAQRSCRTQGWWEGYSDPPVSHSVTSIQSEIAGITGPIQQLREKQKYNIKFLLKFPFYYTRPTLSIILPGRGRARSRHLHRPGLRPEGRGGEAAEPRPGERDSPDDISR